LSEGLSVMRPVTNRMTPRRKQPPLPAITH
jgi:hypothetical protein